MEAHDKLIHLHGSIRAYARSIRPRFKSTKSYVKFLNDIIIVADLIDDMGGEIRSRQIIATLALRYM